MTVGWDMLAAELADTVAAERAKRQPAQTCRYCGAVLPRRTRITVCRDCSDLPASDPHTCDVVTRATHRPTTNSSARTRLLRRTASPASSSPGARGTGGRNTSTGRLAHGPSLSGQDATLPGAPAGRVQAPRLRGATSSEPTLLVCGTLHRKGDAMRTRLVAVAALLALALLTLAPVAEAGTKCCW